MTTTTTYTTTVDSPLGGLVLLGDGEAVTALCLPTHRHRPQIPDGAVEDAAPFAEVAAQLGDYFGGGRRTFDLPMSPRGTEFQRAVWRALADIPYGRTTSYGALAAAIGRPTAVRAVGLANGRNPLPILIPCHRVIGADGALTGYGGGMDAKRLLLDLEARATQPSLR